MRLKIFYFVLIGLIVYGYYRYKKNEYLENQEEGKMVQLPPPAEPLAEISFPVHGTIFVDSNIILTTDPSTFQKLTDVGRSDREMFDRRVDDWNTVNAFLFKAFFNDGLKTEIRVNPEFQTTDSARIEALKYAKIIGQLPTALRKDLRTISIHKGKELYGGGNYDILIHTGQTVEYKKDGILEETLVHEAVHVSIDPYHLFEPAWKKTQEADGKFISKYAKDNPDREDIAETFLLYIAARYRPERISVALRDSIMTQVPNRIKYFDNLKLNMYPIE